MRNYFTEICNVQDADEHFGIDEFSDLIVLTKPVVYFSLQDICDTHKVYSYETCLSLKVYLSCFCFLDFN